MRPDDRSRLLERLLADPEFRARFQHDPAGAAREAGFGGVADELDGAQSPFETLESRESKSSLAGVMLAAAVEGIGLFGPEDDLSGVRAQQALGAHVPKSDDMAAGPIAESNEAAPDGDDQYDEEEPDEDEPDEAEPDEEEPDGEEPANGETPDEETPPQGESDRDDEGQVGSDGSGDAPDDRNDSEPGPTEPIDPTRGDWKPSPDQYGMAGGGGEQSPFDAAVLHNPRITLDANGRQDFAKGRMDPRVGALLLRLAERHTLTLSATTSDHPQYTTGGSVSNHWTGRAFDIATVDGQIVRPGSAAARKLAEELVSLGGSIRPSEIGSPWQISAPGYFTDGAHQDHIHIAFDEVIGRDWTPPNNEARVMPALRGGTG